jgi:mannan endo-1,6-alpha-mannosidase
MRASPTTLGALLLAASGVSAIDLDVNSTDSILSASKTIVNSILYTYNGNGSSGPAIPGLLPKPYYWWESGYMFDSLINYWSLSGDDSVVQTIQDGMLFQVGPDNNYMPPNQSKSLGNDDQAFWALAAMTAAEKGLPMPDDASVSWIDLAKNVFDSQVVRWDEESCGGGLKWQIFTFNNGYNYKNSISQGTFALLAARLARYTGNQTYSDWAQRAVDWTRNIGLLTHEGAVYDGTDDLMNCSEINRLQWTINAGLFLNIGSYMINSVSPHVDVSKNKKLITTCNQTQNDTSAWNDLIWPIFLTANRIFVDSGASANSQGRATITEVACAASDTCNVDQLSYKGILARAYGNFQALTASSPSSLNGTTSADAYSRAASILRASAEGAAAQCSGGPNGTTCGFDWVSDEWDGTQGIGQDLDALEVILANLPAKGLNRANTTVTGTSSNGTTVTATDSGNGTGTQSGSVETSTSGAAGLWSSSALVALFSASFICLLRLSM